MARQQVDFSVVNNPLLKFLLDDGTEINVQMVMMRVTRCDEKLPDGQWKHEFMLQSVVDQIAPADEINMAALLKGKGENK